MYEFSIELKRIGDFMFDNKEVKVNFHRFIFHDISIKEGLSKIDLNNIKSLQIKESFITPI